LAFAAITPSIISIAVAGAMPSPASSSSEAAITFQINTAHTGNIDFSNGFSTPLKQIWTRKFSQYALSYPLIAGGEVFVTGNYSQYDYGAAIALDLATGKTIWNKLLSGTTEGMPGPAYDGGRVFIQDGAGLLTAYDAPTGKWEWSQQVGVYLSNAAPLATAGTVYASAFGDGGVLSAFNEQTGVRTWDAPVNVGDGSIPAYGSGGVFVTYPCNYYRFGAATGKTAWHDIYSSGQVGGHTPALFDGWLFVSDSGNYGCGNYIVDPASGRPVGKFPMSDVAPAFFTDSKGNKLEVYISGGIVYCWNTTTGATVWTFGNGGTTPEAAPIVVNKTIFAGGSFGHGGTYLLVALNENGKQIWSVDPPSSPVVFLAAGEGTLVVVSELAVTAYVPQ
jgi:outer membrane protein assembly factor BamB